MTDLVERLRVPCACGLGLREEAADEIKRLEGLLKAKVTPGYELLADQIEKRDAEIERLSGEMHSMGAHMAHLHHMNDELRKVRDTADLLVNECEGGRNPPSLGILAQLEDALIMAHKGRTK